MVPNLLYYTTTPAKVQLTWANGLLALATDVAAGLAHVHGLRLYHGRLFPCNVRLVSERNPNPNPSPSPSPILTLSLTLTRPNPNPKPDPNKAQS